MAFRSGVARKLFSAYAASDSIAAATADTPFATLNYSVVSEKMVAGRTIRVTIHGTITSSGSAVTVTFKLKYGTTAILTTTALAIQNSQTDVPFKLVIDVHVNSIGATGAVVANYALHTNALAAKLDLKEPAPVTVDTTADAALTLAVASSANTAGNSVKAKSFLVEMVA